MQHIESMMGCHDFRWMIFDRPMSYLVEYSNIMDEIDSLWENFTWDIFGHNSSICRFDSSYNRFQLWWHCFRIELNEFSTFHLLLFSLIALSRLIERKILQEKRKRRTDNGESSDRLAPVLNPSQLILVPDWTWRALEIALIDCSSGLFV